MRRRRFLLAGSTGIGGLLLALRGGSVGGQNAASGGSLPQVEYLSMRPGADETVGTDASIEVATVVSDPDGMLDRIVWREGRNHTIIDETAVSGSLAADTLTFEETPHWIDYGYPTLVTAVAEDGRESELGVVEGPDVRQPLEIDVLETNDPVAAGDRLDVTAAVENVGDMMMVGPDTQEIELVVGDETVDARTVSVGWNETETITLGYDTYPVRQDVEFTARVQGADDYDERTVEVLADGESTLAVAGVDANDPVTGGEYLTVTASVENTGATELTQSVDLVVSDDVADTETVTVPAGSSQQVSLGYETYPVRQDVTFPVTVRTEDDSTDRTVEVLGSD